MVRRQEKSSHLPTHISAIAFCHGSSKSGGVEPAAGILRGAVHCSSLSQMIKLSNPL
jgi:hypothetical protein